MVSLLCELIFTFLSIIQRLNEEASRFDCGAPSKGIWEAIVDGIGKAGAAPINEPNFNKADVIRFLLPVEGAKEYKERTEQEQAKCTLW